MSRNISAVKVGFLSFPIALWIALIEWDYGWVMTLIVIVPLTFLVAIGLALVLELIVEPLLRWLNK